MSPWWVLTGDLLGRTRLCLASSQTFYLLVNNKGLPNMAVTMQELYRDYKDEDGFLYLTYASQEMFGSSTPSPPPRPPGCSSRDGEVGDGALHTRLSVSGKLQRGVDQPSGV